MDLAQLTWDQQASWDPFVTVWPCRRNELCLAPLGCLIQHTDTSCSAYWNTRHSAHDQANLENEVKHFPYFSILGITPGKWKLCKCCVMYIQNVHLKLYLYFGDKLFSKRTGILETVVSRWFSNWHALLEADRSYFHSVNCFINQPSYSKLWQCTTNSRCQHSTFKSFETVPRWGVQTALRWRKIVLTTHKNWWISKIAFMYAYEFETKLLFGVKFRLV